jgi:hypothetical protein
LRGDVSTALFHVMDEAFGLGYLVFCGADGVEIGRVLVAGAVAGSRLDSVDQGADVLWFGVADRLKKVSNQKCRKCRYSSKRSRKDIFARVCWEVSSSVECMLISGSDEKVGNFAV